METIDYVSYAIGCGPANQWDGDATTYGLNFDRGQGYSIADIGDGYGDGQCDNTGCGQDGNSYGNGFV
jgi:hypothetical protein